MWMLLRVSIPIDPASAGAKAGTLGSTVEKSWPISRKPAYFFADDNGNRSGTIVFDMKDTSESPAISEPLVLAFNAKVSVRPIVNPLDFAKAVQRLARPSSNTQSKS